MRHEFARLNQNFHWILAENAFKCYKIFVFCYKQKVFAVYQFKKYNKRRTRNIYVSSNVPWYQKHFDFTYNFSFAFHFSAVILSSLTRPIHIHYWMQEWIQKNLFNSQYGFFCIKYYFHIIYSCNHPSLRLNPLPCTLYHFCLLRYYIIYAIYMHGSYRPTTLHFELLKYMNRLV